MSTASVNETERSWRLAIEAEEAASEALLEAHSDLFEAREHHGGGSPTVDRLVTEVADYQRLYDEAAATTDRADNIIVAQSRELLDAGRRLRQDTHNRRMQALPEAHQRAQHRQYPQQLQYPQQPQQLQYPEQQLQYPQHQQYPQHLQYPQQTQQQQPPQLQQPQRQQTEGLRESKSSSDDDTAPPPTKRLNLSGVGDVILPDVGDEQKESSEEEVDLNMIRDALVARGTRGSPRDDENPDSLICLDELDRGDSDASSPYIASGGSASGASGGSPSKESDGSASGARSGSASEESRESSDPEREVELL